jgi:uncharacterized membrane protein
MVQYLLVYAAVKIKDEEELMSAPREGDEQGFPTSAGILLGLGLGGFFDGILLHQVLQWHHMVTSAGYPPDSVPNLQFNTLLDGLFHATTYVFVAIGLTMLWRAACKTHVRWSGKMLIGTILIGFGIFNLVEGIIDHQILGIHHVNETVARDQWIYWDLGFLAWGAVMLVGGWLVWRTGKQETAHTLGVVTAAPSTPAMRSNDIMKEREVGGR